jgi:hypothetical protein
LSEDATSSKRSGELPLETTFTEKAAVYVRSAPDNKGDVDTDHSTWRCSEGEMKEKAGLHYPGTRVIIVITSWIVAKGWRSLYSSFQRGGNESLSIGDSCA